MSVAKQYPYTPPSKKSDRPWFLIVTLSGIISGMLLFALGWYLSLPTEQKSGMVNQIMSASDIFPNMMGLNHPKVLLVMGVDMPPRGSHMDYRGVRTDTMMLVKVDTAHQKINVISIPRDCKVYIAGRNSVDKINAAFPLGGADTAIQTVQNTFGVHIDNYLMVNLRGVRELVDALGGIDVDVEKPMRYHDNTAHLNINLMPGVQHLNGEQAEGFLRFRHDAYGDIGRIRRQQQFISGLSAKLQNPSILLSLKPLLSVGNENIKTDMSTPDLISLALFGKGLKRSNFEVATLPGHPSSATGISYWIIDPKASEVLLNQMIVEAPPVDQNATTIPTHPKVGILYTENHATDLTTYKAQLATLGFDVTCKAAIRHSSSKLITHNEALPMTLQTQLQHSNPALENAQLILFPHGATYETNSCGPTDYTVVLGDDTRSALKP